MTTASCETKSAEDAVRDISRVVFDTFEVDEDPEESFAECAAAAAQAARLLRGGPNWRDDKTPQEILLREAKDVSGVGEDNETRACRSYLTLRLFAEEFLLEERTAPLANIAEITLLREDALEVIREAEGDDSIESDDIAMQFAPSLIGEDGCLVPWNGLDVWASERGEESRAKIAAVLDDVMTASMDIFNSLNLEGIMGECGICAYSKPTSI